MTREKERAQGSGLILDDEGRTLANASYQLFVFQTLDQGIPVSEETRGKIWGQTLSNTMLSSWQQSMKPVILQLADKRRIKIFIADPHGAFRGHGEGFF